MKIDQNLLFIKVGVIVLLEKHACRIILGIIHGKKRGRETKYFTPCM